MIQVHEQNAPMNTPEEFEHLSSRHEPTVFRGFAQSWLPSDTRDAPAMLKWLDGMIGHCVVPFNMGLPGDSGFIGNANLVGGSPTPTTLIGRRQFRDIAREMTRELMTPTNHLLYIQSLAIDSFVPELRKFLPPAETLPPKGHWRTWIGTGNHHGYLHVDSTDNLYCVLAGQKRMILCPFGVLPDLYIGPLEGGVYNSPASMVDPFQPDLKMYPRFREVLKQAVFVTLEPGDALYLPSAWWHSVESHGFNFSVNYWWTDVEKSAESRAEGSFLRALLSMRALPKHRRSFWKVLFDTFVFQLEEEPYAHLNKTDQGFAGDPSPERVMFIKSRIAELDAGR